MAPHRAAAAVTATSSARPRPVSSDPAGEWVIGSRTMTIQSANSQLSHQPERSSSHGVRLDRSWLACRQAESARNGGSTRLTPGTSQASAEEVEESGSTRFSQLR